MAECMVHGLDPRPKIRLRSIIWLNIPMKFFLFYAKVEMQRTTQYFSWALCTFLFLGGKVLWPQVVPKFPEDDCRRANVVGETSFLKTHKVCDGFPP